MHILFFFRQSCITSSKPLDSHSWGEGAVKPTCAGQSGLGCDRRPSNERLTGTLLHWSKTPYFCRDENPVTLPSHTNNAQRSPSLFILLSPKDYIRNAIQ